MRSLLRLSVQYCGNRKRTIPEHQSHRRVSAERRPTDDPWAAYIVSHNSEFSMRRASNPGDVSWYSGALYWWSGAGMRVVVGECNEAVGHCRLRDQRRGPGHRTSVLRVVHPVERPRLAGDTPSSATFLDGTLRGVGCVEKGHRSLDSPFLRTTILEFEESPLVRLWTVSRFATGFFSLKYTYPSPARI